MALVNCKECGRDISTEAAACPRCGAKMAAPKASGWLTKITHIKCRECGESIGPKDKVCPKCGAKVTIPLAGKVMAALILLVAAVVIFSPSDHPASNSNPDSPKNAAAQLAPEMIVKPVHGQFLAACQTKELLQELLSHSVAHEKTKFVAMFDRLDCVQIPETETYKVLSVSDDMAEIVNVNAKLITSEGMWTVVEAMQPLK